MKSSYNKRNINTRTQYADGTIVTPGPAVNATYPIGYFREDYEYIPTVNSDYLDEHNGRFCVTPEYPSGIYCYFATVDQNWNSAYPYVVGPTFYGVKSAANVASIGEAVSTYIPSFVSDNVNERINVTVFPNPSSDLVVIQVNHLTKENIYIDLYDVKGQLVQNTILFQGSTIAYFDTKTLYSGEYFIKMSNGTEVLNKRITIVK